MSITIDNAEIEALLADLTATTRSLNAPLLFKGDDFTRTDVLVPAT